MKILLTGGTGFIGGYLKIHLPKFHEVYAPTRQELNLLDCDSVKKHLESNFYDTVIHAAVVGREHVKEVENFEISEKILKMFDNFYQNRHLFTKFINFGSGAEFGLENNILDVLEDDVIKFTPKENYGYAKNKITRKILETENFYNLRIFSCIDSSEPNERLLKKFLKAYKEIGYFEVDQDRFVDFFSLNDLLIVVNAVLNDIILYHDLNLTYLFKLSISELLSKYCYIKNLNTNSVLVTGVSEKHYTGNGERLNNYNLPLDGIDQTLKKYII